MNSQGPSGRKFPNGSKEAGHETAAIACGIVALQEDRQALPLVQSLAAIARS